jgi:hypothetical protein
MILAEELEGSGRKSCGRFENILPGGIEETHGDFIEDSNVISLSLYLARPVEVYFF